MDKNFCLELGDIIQITYSDNNLILYVISYIDTSLLELVNLETNELNTFQIVGNQIQHSNRIIKITIMYRNPLKGFALQHQLLPNKKVVIGFNQMGELIGEILELQNDIITVLLYNTYELLYINFKFSPIFLMHATIKSRRLIKYRFFIC